MVLSMNGFDLLYGILENNQTANGSTNFSDIIPTTDNDDKTSWVASAFLLCCVAGAICISVLADILGRKWCIILGSLVFNAGIAMQVSADGFGLSYSGRVTSGWAIGFLSMVVPLFISETAPTAIRGRMVAVQQLMITLGILLASIANTIIIANINNNSNKEWRVALGLQGVPGVLAMKGRDAEAIAVLAKLRSQDMTSPAVQEEYATIRASIDLENVVGNASWSEMAKPGILNRVVLVVFLQLFQQWSGINVILYYQNSLLKAMGFNYDQVKTSFNISVNSFNFIGTFPGMYLIERIGRRRLLIGGMGMATSHYMIVLLLNLSRSHGHGFACVPICFVFTFELCFSSTWGPVVWDYQSEMFPLRIRSMGTGFSTVSNWTNNFFISKYSPHISTSWEFFQYMAMDDLFAANKGHLKHREIAVERDVEFSVVDKKN
ncbi:general substrate transporter [Blyttiomyces helicus]|uniref:General substrate transporter n=1 Tax=Blyttiomyces helicus TaxID=388810 RepID=A0A4V1IQN9_9FUNG|nr:general substrate transporter [Blyttiomyces helicus]|eukprot:RKO87217.1 general substrate transporter [Blyttiomyces helicus]